MKEVIKIRGHHLHAFYQWFVCGRDWTLERMKKITLEKYGKKFVDAKVALLQEIESNLDVKIKLVINEFDSICEHCPPQKKGGASCFVENDRFDPDENMISRYGLKANEIYSAREIIKRIEETYKWYKPRY